VSGGAGACWPTLVVDPAAGPTRVLLPERGRHAALRPSLSLPGGARLTVAGGDVEASAWWRVLAAHAVYAALWHDGQRPFDWSRP
jgi:hypothetical protein